jgi:hypothetical protein
MRTEGTQDPVWLLEIAQYAVPDSILDKHQDLYFTDEEIIQMYEVGDAVKCWKTISVTLSRSEGEKMGERLMRKKDEEWRVRCISLWDTIDTKDKLRSLL